jgi:hypothetical protein
MTGEQLFRMWVQSCLCIDEYEWYKLSEVRRNNWQNLADRLFAPDFKKIGAAFGVGGAAARTYFEGGSFDPIGMEAIRIAIHRVEPNLLDYVGQEYVRRLIAACARCGVPTDQLVAIEYLANNP